VKEAIPPNALHSLGNTVDSYSFEDPDHAGDKLTRRLQKGIILFLNRASIIWYSKEQNTVKTSSFGSEFVAV
jgi:hypothetical protein